MRSYKLLLPTLACCLAITPAAVAQNQQTEQYEQEQYEQSDQKSQPDDSQKGEQWIEKLDSKVDLSDDQKQQIRSKTREFSQKMESTWEKFHQAHTKAIVLEASMYAAMENEMTSQQRDSFQKNRDRNASANGMDRMADNRNEEASGNQVRETSYRETVDDSYRETVDDNESEQQTSDRQSGDDDWDTAEVDQERRESNWSESDSPSKSDDSRMQSSNRDSTEAIVSTFIIVPARRAAAQSGLNPEQQMDCNATCQKFEKKLGNAWKNIHRYHREMVKIEAQKINVVTEVLDEQQLQQLNQGQDTSETASSDTQDEASQDEVNRERDDDGQDYQDDR